MTFERILSHFQVRKRGTGKAQCICPAHADREASLTLTDGNDRALIKCHAGCSTEEVVIAAGLKMSDLFYEDGLAKERWRAYIENREKRKIEAVYNYASINGDYAYTKVRLEGKKMLFGILSNERFAYGLNGKNKKTFNAVYGSISSIKRAIERKEPVFIPEGEKDVNTLVKKGYAAFSCGGANDWNKNVSELCKDADVIVLTDNDDPGKKLASTVVRDLKGTAKSIKIIIPMPEVPKADITDYFEAGHTVEEFENLIRNVDDTEKICADVQQDQKQDIGKKRSVIQKNKDEVAGGPALVFKFLDYNYDEDGNVKSVKQLVHNFEVVMDKDSRFAGKIRLNEFAQQPYLYGSVPWENENNCRAWSSHDDSALFSLIQADYVGMFVAALTGQSSFVKAVGVQEDYAAGLEKTSKNTNQAAKSTKKANKETEGYLSTLDEIQRYTSNKNDDSAADGNGIGDTGGYTAPTPAQMFKKVPVADSIKGIADKIKKLIKSEDWEGLGKYIASGINKGLKKVYEAISWKKVGPKITKFCDAFTRTFNSLVDNVDWKLLGRTVGAGINTIVNTLNLLITGIDWKNLGKKFAEGITGLVKEVNWN